MRHLTESASIMLDLPYPISLTRCRDGSQQVAEIAVLTRGMAISGLKGQWWAAPDVSATAGPREGDYHWDWVDHVGSQRPRFYARCIAVRTPEGHLQAAMTYHVDGRSTLDPGQKAVFGDRLATAPWNRDRLVSAPLYRGAGTALMLHAIRDGHKLGLGGRVVLLSLPDPETVIFYERLGFQQTVERKGGMIIYELTPERASHLLSARGLL